MLKHYGVILADYRKKACYTPVICAFIHVTHEEEGVWGSVVSSPAGVWAKPQKLCKFRVNFRTIRNLIPKQPQNAMPSSHANCACARPSFYSFRLELIGMLMHSHGFFLLFRAHLVGRELGKTRRHQ